MNQRRLYSVSELAEAVGVARTTLNDWLVRHADYLDSEFRGKRRVYSDDAVKLLREVAALREAGRIPAEIDQELAQRHPIRPEVTSPAAAEPAAATTLPAVPEAADGEASALPALLKWSESAQQFAGELQQLVAGLKEHQLEQERLLRQARRRGRLAALGFAAVLLLTAAAGFRAWHTLDRSRREHEAELLRQYRADAERMQEAWRQEAERRDEAARAGLAQWREERAELEKTLRAEREANAAQTRTLLELQEAERQAFSDRLAGSEAQYGEAAAEIRTLRGEFAARQEEYRVELKRLETRNAELDRALEHAAATVAEAAERMAAMAEKTPENLQKPSDGDILESLPVEGELP